MKKQIFTIILFTVVSLNVLGQFRLDGGTSSLRLQTGGIDRLYVQPTTGNVGIGTNGPTAKLEINGDVRLRPNVEILTTATHDPLMRDGKSYIMVYNSTNATVTTIKGFDAAPDGTLLYLTNDYYGSVIIKHNVATVVENGIESHTGGDVTINSHGGAIFIYSNQRWKLISFTQ